MPNSVPGSKGQRSASFIDKITEQPHFLCSHYSILILRPSNNNRLSRRLGTRFRVWYLSFIFIKKYIYFLLINNILKYIKVIILMLLHQPYEWLPPESKSSYITTVNPNEFFETAWNVEHHILMFFILYYCNVKLL